MGKAALLLRNVSNDRNDVYDQIKDLSEHIVRGDTLNNDAFSDMTFDYQLSNPPYGKKFEVEQDDVIKEHNTYGYAGRFGAGVPPVNDGSMLFLQNAISKMRSPEEGGGKIGIVLSGSPLFNGDPGSDSSNIRRWIFEKDYLDCIVKMPTGLFYRTGINTYLWILSNKKPEDRKGFVQLIDASERFTAMSKSIGNKRREFSRDDIDWIVKTYVDGHNGGHSVMVPYTDFMFRRITTQRPLRMRMELSGDNAELIRSNDKLNKLSSENMSILVNGLKEAYSNDLPFNLKPYSWAGEFAKTIRKEMNKPNVGAPAIEKAIIETYGIKGSEFEPVTDKKRNVVPDPDLKDTEDIPWGMDFDKYMSKNVFPYAPDAWIDESVTDKNNLSDGKVGIVGTNISFNKYFYHYEEPEKPEKIENEIEELNKQFVSVMSDLFK